MPTCQTRISSKHFALSPSSDGSNRLAERNKILFLTPRPSNEINNFYKINHFLVSNLSLHFEGFNDKKSNLVRVKNEVLNIKYYKGI